MSDSPAGPGVRYRAGTGVVVRHGSTTILLATSLADRAEAVYEALLAERDPMSSIADRDGDIAVIAVAPKATTFVVRGDDVHWRIITPSREVAELAEFRAGWRGGAVAEALGWQIRIGDVAAANEDARAWPLGSGIAAAAEVTWGELPVTEPEAAPAIDVIDPVQAPPAVTVVDPGHADSAESNGGVRDDSDTEPAVRESPRPPAAPVEDLDATIHDVPPSAPPSSAPPSAAPQSPAPQPSAPQPVSEVDDYTVHDVPMRMGFSTNPPAAQPPSAPAPIPVISQTAMTPPQMDAPAPTAPPVFQAQRFTAPTAHPQVPVAPSAPIQAPPAAMPPAVPTSSGSPTPPAPAATAAAPAPAAPPAAATEPPAPFVPQLVSNQGHLVTLTASVVIGRHPSAERAPNPHGAQTLTMISPREEISRSHCIVTYDAGNVLVWDLNSANGTQLLRNGRFPEPLTPQVPVVLDRGDIIDLGDGAALWLA
ncbi:FHA domain-containing protein [Gulosibacter macacae]|uniref:FHA domain-containing protein n=1 Tax=Gulosibacter macacae TaxID=2488791 RepID=A0A3P3VTP0_9MICO|nr:FHA domain-containing protein [Gulosibacter macacae]RRJ86155.1 FHA domain-containing protein [Gulosibacter macacae]